MHQMPLLINMTIALIVALLGSLLARRIGLPATGASVVAVIRAHQLIANPRSSMLFAAGDRTGVIREADQIARARLYLEGE